VLANFTFQQDMEDEPVSGPGAEPSASSDNRREPIKWNDFVRVVTTRKVDAALWVTRLMTIVFSTLYILPLFGNPLNFYYKAFLANAATSALRLHQRVPVVAFNRVFMTQLLLEDSCHYLFYSLIFIYCSPITLAIMPILLFAVLHFASFSLTLLDAMGRNSIWIARVFITMVEFQTVTILRMAAGAEIFTMQFTIIYALIGRASLLTPFIYYRFLTLRYSSRRNHYTRTMFRELRVYCERVAMSPKCPAFVANLINKSIDIVSRFAPEIPPSAN
jgi:hypothetical protein